MAKKGKKNPKKKGIPQQYTIPPKSDPYSTQESIQDPNPVPRDVTLSPESIMLNPLPDVPLSSLGPAEDTNNEIKVETVTSSQGTETSGSAHYHDSRSWTTEEMQVENEPQMETPKTSIKTELIHEPLVSPFEPPTPGNLARAQALYGPSSKGPKKGRQKPSLKSPPKYTKIKKEEIEGTPTDQARNRVEQDENRSFRLLRDDEIKQESSPERDSIPTSRRLGDLTPTEVEYRQNEVVDFGDQSNWTFPSTIPSNSEVSTPPPSNQGRNNGHEEVNGEIQTTKG